MLELRKRILRNEKARKRRRFKMLLLRIRRRANKHLLCRLFKRPRVRFCKEGAIK